jgi:hypothetical protein
MEFHASNLSKGGRLSTVSISGIPVRREVRSGKSTTRRPTMRFMMMVKANKESEAGVMPSMELLLAMGKYNEELVKAGVLLAADGLQSSAKGARVKFTGDKRTVVDGPFAETKELIAGFWMIQVKSKEEAIEWAKRCPNPHGTGEAEIEVRQVFDSADFAPQLGDSEAGRAILNAEQEFRQRTGT